LGGSLSKLCPTAPPSIQDGCCYYISTQISEQKI
jgi:hypothetical protein